MSLEICQHCDEIIAAGERSDVMGVLWHYECGIRNIVGSRAHIMRRCSCFVRGSREGDDPNLSKRENARQAVMALQELHATR